MSSPTDQSVSALLEIATLRHYVNKLVLLIVCPFFSLYWLIKCQKNFWFGVGGSSPKDKHNINVRVPVRVLPPL